jgi:hypothetical protein
MAQPVAIERPPYQGEEKLVIGFDIGTTYSGVSFCILQEGREPRIYPVTR